MAQYTPNFNLYKPDSMDDFADFRAEHNNNMDIIDQNLGGGGGSGGHTIYDKDGNALAQESGLQFTGNVNVSDDSVNGRTVVDITGGGGNVYGAFVDPSRVITSGSWTSSLSYNAAEDCFVFIDGDLQNTHLIVNVDGVKVYDLGSSSYVEQMQLYPLKKGQTLTATKSTNYALDYIVYGITQGTNGIYAPVIYSDNERVIGVWRDNKPLYAKTWVLTIPSATGTYSFNEATPNLENVVHTEYSLWGLGERGDTPWYTPATISFSGQTASYIEFYFASSNYAGREIYFTSYYTKTTDVAGSGNWNTDGVPTHHYSTSEQVVGTWIDGKPLYEMTLTHSGALIVDNSFANDIGSLVSVDQFIGCEGYFRRTNANGLMYSLNGGTRPEGSADNKVSARYYNGNVQVAVNGYNDIEYIALTVRYTKTTDT